MQIYQKLYQALVNFKHYLGTQKFAVYGTDLAGKSNSKID